MFKKLKNTLIIVGGLGMILAPAMVAVGSASAANQTLGGCASTGATLSLSSDCASGTTDNTNSVSQLSNLAKIVVNVFSIVVGIIAVIMIIVGGIKYVVSGGESSAVSGAKNTILFAIIGLVVVALAQIVVHFVLAKLTATGASGGTIT